MQLEEKKKKADFEYLNENLYLTLFSAQPGTWSYNDFHPLFLLLSLPSPLPPFFWQ